VNVLQSFEKELPFEHQSDLVSDWEFLYERSLVRCSMRADARGDDGWRIEIDRGRPCHSATSWTTRLKQLRHRESQSAAGSFSGQEAATRTAATDA
jgi:hypothetical protein